MAPTGEYSHGNPLAHLSESVNAIDPLNAMEKTINEVHKYAVHFDVISIAIIGMCNVTKSI